MQFYDVIEKRTSIKKFKDTSIPEDKLARMINAAMMAPSWKNKTSYRFILVRDENKKAKVSEAIKNNTNEASESVQNAPIVAVIVGDPSLSGEIGDKNYFMVDSAIAMEHFVLAATAEDLGTCWIASFDENKIKDALNIPDNFRVVALTPVGEIAENKEHYAKKDIRDYVFMDSFNVSYNNREALKH